MITNNQPVRIRLPRDKEWSEAERVLAQREETSYAVRNRKYLQIFPEPEESDSSRTSQEGARRPVGESSTCDIHSPCGPPIANNTYVTKYCRVVKPVERYQAS